MKRPGLTEAMRRALERMRDDADNCRLPNAMANKLFDLGLSNGHNLTPRGQAALAAPRVTAAELAMLERCAALSRGGEIFPYGAEWRALRSLKRRGWITSAFVDCFLTPAGTTALNNIRAASGSPEWKP